jgi:hypothetical protein
MSASTESSGHTGTRDVLGPSLCSICGLFPSFHLGYFRVGIVAVPLNFPQPESPKPDFVGALSSNSSSSCHAIFTLWHPISHTLCCSLLSFSDSFYSFSEVLGDVIRPPRLVMISGSHNSQLPTREIFPPNFFSLAGTRNAPTPAVRPGRSLFSFLFRFWEVFMNTPSFISTTNCHANVVTKKPHTST